MNLKIPDKFWKAFISKGDGCNADHSAVSACLLSKDRLCLELLQTSVGGNASVKHKPHAPYVRRLYWSFIFVRVLGAKLERMARWVSTSPSYTHTHPPFPNSHFNFVSFALFQLSSHKKFS